jgi:hypothetical protein
MYKQYKNLDGTVSNGIIRLSDNAFIPMDEANSDYQEYLKFLAEGGQTLPADSE